MAKRNQRHRSLRFWICCSLQISVTKMKVLHLPRKNMKLVSRRPKEQGEEMTRKNTCWCMLYVCCNWICCDHILCFHLLHVSAHLSETIHTRTINLEKIIWRAFMACAKYINVLLWLNAIKTLLHIFTPSLTFYLPCECSKFLLFVMLCSIYICPFYRDERNAHLWRLFSFN